MTTHIIALTYQPKIEAVFEGNIRQTVRAWFPGKPYKRVGDKIIIHTWQGKPYRSKWGNRMEAIVTEEFLITIQDQDEAFLSELAVLDGIAPPTAAGLKETLAKLNPGYSGFYQVVRWQPIKAFFPYPNGNGAMTALFWHENQITTIEVLQ